MLDSVESIVSGGVGKVASLIENTLAKILPARCIGFLASLLGLGGISEKIKEILEKVQKPVMKAVDKVIDGALKLGKGLLKKLGIGKKKDKGGDKGDVKAQVAAESPHDSLVPSEAQAHCRGFSAKQPTNTRSAVSSRSALRRFPASRASSRFEPRPRQRSKQQSSGRPSSLT